MTDLTERLDEMGRHARDRAEVAPTDAVIARSARRHHNRRRTSVLAVAAAVIAVAIIGGVLVSNSSRHTRVTTTDQQHGAGPHLEPTVWPSELTGPTSTGRSPARDSLPGWVLEHDGRAAISAQISPFPNSEPSLNSSVERVTVNGQAGWAWTNGDDQLLGIAIHPGWTLEMSSRVVDRSTLEEVAAAFDPTDDRISTAELPRGWSIAPNPFGIASILHDGGVMGSGSDVAERRNDDEQPTPTGLALSSHWTHDAPAIVASMRQLFGLTEKSDGTIPGSVDLGLGGVMRATAEGHSLVVWAFSRDVIAVASARRLSQDDLLASLRSVRAVSDAVWARTESPQLHNVDGFELRDDEKVVQQGTIGDNRWMVTTSPTQSTLSLPHGFQPPDDPRAHTMVNLYIRSADGLETGGGSTLSSSSGDGYTRGDRVSAVEFGTPLGIRDPQVRFEGRDVPTVAIPMPALDATFVFGVLATRDTDDPGKATLTATLPDGSPYNWPRPSGG